MRGEWRNAFLLVVAAQELAETKEDEQQQQQEDEQLQRSELHPCVAETPLDSVASDSGRTALCRSSS